MKRLSFLGLALELASLAAFTWFTNAGDFYASLFFGVMFLACAIDNSVDRVVRVVRESNARDQKALERRVDLS